MESKREQVSDFEKDFLSFSSQDNWEGLQSFIDKTPPEIIDSYFKEKETVHFRSEEVVLSAMELGARCLTVFEHLIIKSWMQTGQERDKNRVFFESCIESLIKKMDPLVICDELSVKKRKTYGFGQQSVYDFITGGFDALIIVTIANRFLDSPIENFANLSLARRELISNLITEAAHHIEKEEQIKKFSDALLTLATYGNNSKITQDNIRTYLNFFKEQAEKFPQQRKKLSVNGKHFWHAFLDALRKYLSKNIHLSRAYSSALEKINAFTSHLYHYYSPNEIKEEFHYRNISLRNKLTALDNHLIAEFWNGKKLADSKNTDENILCYLRCLSHLYLAQQEKSEAGEQAREELRFRALSIVAPAEPVIESKGMSEKESNSNSIIKKAFFKLISDFLKTGGDPEKFEKLKEIYTLLDMSKEYQAQLKAFKEFKPDNDTQPSYCKILAEHYRLSLTKIDVRKKRYYFFPSRLENDIPKPIVVPRAVNLLRYAANEKRK